MIIRAVYPTTVAIYDNPDRSRRTLGRAEFWEFQNVKIRRSLMHEGMLTERALDDRELFKCDRCWVIFTYDFGCDVGLPDIQKAREQAQIFRGPIPEVFQHAYAHDEMLRQWCDDCWAEIVLEGECALFPVPEKAA